MAAFTTRIPIPRMEQIEQNAMHVQCVKLLATALTAEDYSVAWTTNNDGVCIPPSGIKNAVSQVYGKLRQHPLIGKYIIPESLADNPDWLGFKGDRILCNEFSTVVTSNHKIHWDAAVMAASVFLRQKYLEVIADMHLWNMGADANASESGIAPVQPSYQPTTSHKSPGFNNKSSYSPHTPPYSNRQSAGWSSEYDEDATDIQNDEALERTYFIQNRSDYRLLNPRAIRVLLHGNYRINERSEPGLTNGMTMGGRVNAFDGLSNLDDMVVSLFGMQYRSVTVQAAIPAPATDSKSAAPPSYDDVSGTIDICPQIGFLTFHKEVDHTLVFAETGGVTFVRQPHVTGQSTTVEEPQVPSSNFFSGIGEVSHRDAMLLWASTPLAIISTFGLIKQRILRQHFSSQISRSRTVDALYQDQLDTAERINHRNVDPDSIESNSSATIVRFGYNDRYTEATVKHFALNQMKEDYTKKNGDQTKLYLFHALHVRQEAERQRKMKAYREHKSCEQRCGEACCIFWCGKKDWCEQGELFPDCPTCGVCGILCSWMCLKYPFTYILCCCCRK